MIDTTPFGSGSSSIEWLESLLRLATALGRSTTRAEFCCAALDVLGSTLRVTRSAVLLLDGEGAMRFECWRGLSEDYRRAVAGHSPWRPGGPAPEPFAIEHACSASALAPVRKALASEGIVSLAFVPLLAQGRLLGKFMLYSDAPRRFTDAELRFAAAVGNHIAFAVERQAGADLQQQLHDQLQGAQRLESIGKLAGGVAHDFNNLLTVILGFSELAIGKLAPDSAAAFDLQQIRVAAERAMELTRQLLAFARRQRVELQDVHLGEIIAELCPMARRLLGEQIELVVLPGGQPWPVKVDRAQMEQVILNLAVNARDAMPTGGTITMDVRNVVLRAAEAAACGGIPPGDYVRLVVEDNGVGMAPEVCARVFEPFFTTKEVGRGTGLGLSTCYGVIKQFGGHIGVASEPRRGSRFSVWLPRATEPTALRERVAVPREPARGRGTVLLVEDEQPVRELLTRTLRAGGYDVMVEVDGAAALRAAADHPGPIDLLFTDLVMPQMGGAELADRLLVSRPQMRVLFTSGYSDGGSQTGGKHAFLAKPFTPSVVLRRVGAVLDGSDGQGLAAAAP